METVVATVSGYHGTERFKLIRLIACTGANYVGAMDRSITHLVCWDFQGSKYDLARKLGTHVISHRWFEDCFKQGRRLPEGPYTMQSGKEVGPISWELPSSVEDNGKKIRPFFGERNEQFDHCYKSMHSAKGKEIDPVQLNWSDSHLLKENSFHGWDSQRRLSRSKACRKSQRVLKKVHQSGKHQILIRDDPVVWPKLSSRSSPSLSHQGKLYVDANGELKAETTNESHHLVKVTGSINPLENLSASSTIEMVPESLFFEREESRRIWNVEDMEEPNDYSMLVNVDSSKGCQALTVEGNSGKSTVEGNSGKSTVEGNSLIRDSEGIRERDVFERRKNYNALVAPVSLHHQAELSCVICWTEFCSSRGVLPCGHRFCYSCIQEWAACMASRGKVSTCPLCKANFTSITKFDELASSDQKIFSQTVPCSSSKVDIFLPPDNSCDTFRASSAVPVCIECQNREPEDLLLNCHICQSQWVHSCCLDPPLIPWTCIHCRDLRILYQRFR